MPTYRIRSGIHYEGEKAFSPDGPDGDVFESNADLLKHNVRGCSPRFELLGDSPDGLEALTVKQLRELAQEEDFDLGQATLKDDIIAAIRGLRAVRGPKEAAQLA